MFDSQRVLAHEVLLEGFHRLFRGLQETPGARLTQSCDPFVRVYPHEQVAGNGNRLNVCNFHPHGAATLLAKAQLRSNRRSSKRKQKFCKSAAIHGGGSMVKVWPTFRLADIIVAVA